MCLVRHIVSYKDRWMNTLSNITFSTNKILRKLCEMSRNKFITRSRPIILFRRSFDGVKEPKILKQIWEIQAFEHSFSVIFHLILFSTSVECRASNFTQLARRCPLRSKRIKNRIFTVNIFFCFRLSWKMEEIFV